LIDPRLKSTITVRLPVLYFLGIRIFFSRISPNRPLLLGAPGPQ
jgi:hypothetical protein